MIIYKHSDDLGMTLKNCESILNAWDGEFIDGFSVIANDKTCGYIKMRLNQNPFKPARIAVHLNLTDGNSIASKKTVPVLVDEFGYLKISFIRALWINIAGGKKKSDFLNQVEIEWKTQIEKVKDCIGDRSITFLDSHYHIHMVPSLFRLTANLCKQYNIPQIRRTKEFFYFSEKQKENFSIIFLINITKHFLLNFLSRLNKIPAPISSSADYVAGVLYSGHMNKGLIKKIIAVAAKRKISSLEILLHVGFTDLESLKDWTNNKGSWNHYSSKGPIKEWEAVKEIYYAG